MFWQHYLENKKPIFLACIPEQVYAAILEFSKNKDFFSRSLKFLWHGFCKTARKKQKQAKMVGTSKL